MIFLPLLQGVGAHRRVKRKAINTEYNVVEKWDAGILHYRIIESYFRKYRICNKKYADPIK